MKVVGGTYLEEVELPDDVDLGGSGLRAARALMGWRPDVTLHTCVDEATHAVAAAVAAGSGLRACWHGRDREMAFRYLNPLFVPGVRGRDARGEDFAVDDDEILAFSMLETQPRVTSRRLVYDVQGVTDMERVREAIAGGEHVALLANTRELELLGRSQDPRRSARAVRESLSVDVVVCKQAALGVLVADDNGTHRIGPYPTDSVWPIGSGDVFAAGFAHAWLSGAKPRHAARRGSWAASIWCSTRRLETDRALQTSPQRPPSPKPGRVYLAGPFFDLGQRHLVNAVRAALLDLGGQVFSPLHDVGLGGADAGKLDLQALRDCSAVLALLDGHDPGTVLECGWARRDDMPVIAYAARLDPEARIMLFASGAEIHDDLPTAAYRSLWKSVGL